MEFQDNDQACSLVQQLLHKRHQGTLCDLILKTTSNAETYAHRCVLSTTTPYFKAMFEGEFAALNDDKLGIPCDNIDVLNDIVDCLYDGKIIISQDDVHEVLQVADFICSDKIKSYCGQVLAKHMCKENCLATYVLIDRYSLDEIKYQLIDIMSKYMDELLRTDDMANLPLHLVQMVLSDPKLNYVREQKLFSFIVKWTSVSYDERKTHFPALYNLLEQEYIPALFVSDAVLRSPVVQMCLSRRELARLSTLAQQANSEAVSDVVICHGSGTSSSYIAYIPHKDVWCTLPDSPRTSAMKLESMVSSNDMIVSTYSTPSEPLGVIYGLNLKEKTWRVLDHPLLATGSLRLLAHNSTLYGMDNDGQMFQYIEDTNVWVVLGAKGFASYEKQDRHTDFILPMGMRKYICVFRVYKTADDDSAINSGRNEHIKTSYAIYLFNTVSHRWSIMSEKESAELGLDGYSRFHEFTMEKDCVVLGVNDKPSALLKYVFKTSEWVLIDNCNVPAFIESVVGSTMIDPKLYMVVMTSDLDPSLFMYDRDRSRYKSLAMEPMCLSGHICHLQGQSAQDIAQGFDI